MTIHIARRPSGRGCAQFDRCPQFVVEPGTPLQITSLDLRRDIRPRQQEQDNHNGIDRDGDYIRRRISRPLIHIIGHDVPPRPRRPHRRTEPRTHEYGADEKRTQPAVPSDPSAVSFHPSCVPGKIIVAWALCVGLVRSMDLGATWFLGKKGSII
jgi:hypothetical protein